MLLVDLAHTDRERQCVELSSLLRVSQLTLSGHLLKLMGHYCVTLKRSYIHIGPVQNHHRLLRSTIPHLV